MTLPMLEPLFAPRAIAVIGASPDAHRPGGHPLVALRDYGYRGRVHPVNPKYGEINGVRCLAKVSEIEGACDLALVAVPAVEVPGVIEACGAAGIRSAIVFSAGFSEIGLPGAPLQAQLELAIRRSGVRVVGPNCTGVLNLSKRMFAGFGSGFRNPQWLGGPVAMISQSGGFAYSIMSFCQEQGVGMDYMVSTGNETDLTALDFIEYFLGKTEVRLIAVYLEGLKDGRRLRELGRRALEVGKPIAVWKTGNTDTGRKAALSHTANLTEAYDYYRDAFREGGFIELHEVYDLIDAAKAFRTNRRPSGRRVAVVTTSGGAGVLLSDACELAGLELPALTGSTTRALSKIVPAFASLANPVDLTAALAQTEAAFSQATELVVSDPNVDLLILRSYPGRDADDWASRLASSAAMLAKPVFVSLSGTPAQSADWVPCLEDVGIACFEVPTRAAAAASMLCTFTDRQRSHRAVRVLARPVERQSIPVTLAFDEASAKACLDAYGIPTPKRLFIPADQVAPAGIRLRFPVVVKIVSPDIVHKTEIGGVRLGVSLCELPGVLTQMRCDIALRAPEARFAGFLLEEMFPGVEVLVGAVVNPAFGPLITVGAGGVQAEIFRDVARRYAPFDIEAARQLVMRLKCARLLQGFRGSRPADIDALCDVVSRLSWLIVDHEARISEIEMNPVMVGPVGLGVCAVDAVVRLRTDYADTASSGLLASRKHD